jgi:integrase
VASVRKFKGSNNWYCCYRDETGQRRQVTTKLTDRTEALNYCINIEEQAKKATKGRLVEALARKEISRMVENVSGDSMEFYTTQSWLEEWLEQAKAANSPHTYARYEGFVKAFLRHLGAKTSKDIAVIGPKDIQSFRDNQVKVGKTPQTANLSVKCLSVPFNQARRLGYIQNNPCEAVRSLKVQKKDKAVFSPTQIEEILSVADSEWKGVILLGFYTGARLRDITTLRREHLDFDQGVITFIQSKTGKVVRVPMHQAVKRCLAPLKNLDPEDPVFPSLVNKGVAGKSGLSSSFKKLLQKAGIRTKTIRKAKGEGRNVSDLTFHSLRHTFNSSLANSGISEEIRGRLTGHASTSQNQTYTHIEHQLLTKAIRCLPILMTKI